MFSYLRARYGGCQLRRHWYAFIHSYTHMFVHPLYVYMLPVPLYIPIHLYAPIPPVHLYVLPMPYVPHTSWRIGGICTPHVSWGLQYICQAFQCLFVHPFACQLITVMPVVPHHCGLLFLDGMPTDVCYASCCCSLLFSIHYVSNFYYDGYDYYCSSDCCVFQYIISSHNG